MLEHLFGSRTRVKLLRLFFKEPNKRFFVRELTRLLDVQINAVRRELVNVTKAGIVSAITDDTVEAGDDPHEGKRKYYKLNDSSPLFPELRALLLKSHVLGEQSLVRDLSAIGGVDLLLFTGVFTNVEAMTPVDMLVVGDISEKQVEHAVATFEREHGAQIRYTVLTTKEYYERKHLTDRFLYSVLDAPNQISINKLKRL